MLVRIAEREGGIGYRLERYEGRAKHWEPLTSWLCRSDFGLRFAPDVGDAVVPLDPASPWESGEVFVSWKQAARGSLMVLCDDGVVRPVPYEGAGLLW